MRIVVTGRDGQVACSLVERAQVRGHEIIPVGRPELELAGKPASIMAAIERERPNVIVSAAAFTKVDLAESEPDLAFAINERGAGAVARAAHELGVPLIHLSTDYVFDGTKTAAYTEEDATSPTSIYGASKLAGEQAALAEHDNTVVLRTAWVYSPFGSNFVRTMLKLAAQRAEVTVVSDQKGNPTNALDIADAIFRIADNLCMGATRDQVGVFHMTAAGEASWAEFADRIFQASSEAGGPAATVKHIATTDYPTAARRPANSTLECGKLARVHGIRLPEWRSSLTAVVDRLVRPAA